MPSNSAASGQRKLWNTKTVALALIASLLACNSSYSVDYIPTGTLVVTVHDQSDKPVSGADVKVLEATDSYQWASGITGNDGVVSFAGSQVPGGVGLLGGSFRASLTPPKGYVVAPGQANPVGFKITDKRTTQVDFKVTSTP